MSNVYHSDIYQFNKPVNSYWEATSSENLNLDKLQKDISSEYSHTWWWLYWITLCN